jgi:hypothetical protein
MCAPMSPRAPNRLVIVSVATLMLALFPSSIASGSENLGVVFIAEPLAPLLNSHRWILQGEHLSNGACRYRYPTESADLPTDGWVLRSIAIDMSKCRKLIEEGTPTTVRSDAGSGIALKSLAINEGATTPWGANLTASTQGAWQKVSWRDFFGLLLNADITQINWTYNGSTVSGGTTVAGWQWNYATQWQLGTHGANYLYGPGSSYYRGDSWATFSNSYFCPAPTVHTYYYNNRVWGHPDGHATRSQSSDSVDECLPLHIYIESAYGQWSP